MVALSEYQDLRRDSNPILGRFAAGWILANHSPMPELPEVETFRNQMDRALRGKTLKLVTPDLDDHIVYDKASPETVRDAIQGAKVLGSGRKGKYFWLILNRRPWPVFHLGMTGNVEIRKPGKSSKAVWVGNPLRTGKPKKREPGDIPWFCRILLQADDGTQVAVTDPRRFGRIRLAQDPLTEPPISKLGYDPLGKFPSARELAKILGRRKAPIKAVLLDQGLFAGVGNWIADEVLFQSGIAPRRLGSSLSATEVTKLRTKLLSIIRKAVSTRADYTLFPKHWLFHHRWGKKKNARTHKQLKIAHTTVGGRTTAWVPEVQK